MAEFTFDPLDDPDPFVGEASPDDLSPSVPLNPPMLGEATPFTRLDGQSRDTILEAIRSWIRGPFWKWATSWQTYLVRWLLSLATWLNNWVTSVVAWLNAWLNAADSYITANVRPGLNIWHTSWSLAPTGITSGVVIDNQTDSIGYVHVATAGDLVVSNEGEFTIITSVDVTSSSSSTVTVTHVGNFQGLSIWLTETALADAPGSTEALPLEIEGNAIRVGDSILSSNGTYGTVTAVPYPFTWGTSTVTVTSVGRLLGSTGEQGVQGPSIWITDNTLPSSGTASVIPNEIEGTTIRVGDAIMDGSGTYGNITEVPDPFTWGVSTVEVKVVGSLKGKPGAKGGRGPRGSSLANSAQLVTMTITTTEDIEANASSVGTFGDFTVGGADPTVAYIALTVDCPQAAWIRCYGTGVSYINDAGRNIDTTLDPRSSNYPFLEVIHDGDGVWDLSYPGISVSNTAESRWYRVYNNGTTTIAAGTVITIQFARFSTTGD